MQNGQLTKKIANDLLQEAFNALRHEDGGDGYLDIDEMVRTLNQEFHPSTISQMLQVTGAKDTEELVIMYLDEGAAIGI